MLEQRPSGWLSESNFASCVDAHHQEPDAGASSAGTRGDGITDADVETIASRTTLEPTIKKSAPKTSSGLRMSTKPRRRKRKSGRWRVVAVYVLSYLLAIAIACWFIQEIYTNWY